MKTKTLLFIFALLTMAMVSIMASVIIIMVVEINKPTKVSYTVNIHQYNTYNVTVNEPAKPNIVSKPKVTTKTNGYSDGDIYLLAQLINAEAKGEPFNGKVAVGDVIINRTKSDEFPNTIKGVIFQPRQFQPVSNGAINEKPSDESIRAAKTALTTNLIGNALYFYNPRIATDDWIRTRQVTTTIGHHSFAQ